MRRAFEDPALESRFLTEAMGQRALRSDIPINLPDAQASEARSLRNRLLMYRFKTLAHIGVDTTLVDPTLSPRLNQILVPLLSVIPDRTLQARVRDSVRSLDLALYGERSTSTEAGVLEILADRLRDAQLSSLSVSEITHAFDSRFGKEYSRPITTRFIGSLLRNRLHLLTYKRHGIYVLPASEKPKIEQLCVRYGLTDANDGGG
jgi:hypothetical protein